MSSSTLNVNPSLVAIFASEASSAIYQVLPEAPATYKEVLAKGLFLSANKEAQLQNKPPINQVALKSSSHEKDDTPSSPRLR